MKYVDNMREVLLAIDKMQADIRVYTVGKIDEGYTIYPLISLYEQVSHINIRCLEQGIINKYEYELINEVVVMRVKKYRDILKRIGVTVR